MNVPEQRGHEMGGKEYQYKTHRREYEPDQQKSPRSYSDPSISIQIQKIIRLGSTQDRNYRDDADRDEQNSIENE